MRDPFVRVAGVLVGGIAGYQAVILAYAWVPAALSLGFVDEAAGVVLGGLVGFLLGPPVARVFVNAMEWVLGGLSHLSLHDLLLAAFGLTSGLVLAFFVGYLLEGVPLIGPYVRLVAGIVLGYLGLHVALRRRDEVSGALLPQGRMPAGGRPGPQATPKILDTSVIIDGRIAEICTSGFLEGPLFVPRSVLAELQRIADSPDALRRNRGRRGLDILNRLRREMATVQILDEEAPPGQDVDARLVTLAKMHHAAIVTTDFNLGKVAELEGVRVLNVNQMAQALRPPVLPGEELSVHVVRDGKEAGQGVAYMEDGTMVVVEGGRRYIGETFDVVVTSALQTSAGRMVFARPKMGDPAGRPDPERG
ncbi:MAG: TRAM domain-containing protein [Armatimonadetes bacterium]|nr:TRAM domain-containing protein [Armatimonadota bacterium]